ncbi:MAG: nucleotidyl transferase AbiEii/AbiGii toxin family protein [Candidatus Latescibacterota bacterium]
MFGGGALTFHEFAMHEPLPLAVLHEAALEFLRSRDDVVLFGAHAVNAYVGEPRMTQDLDVLSTCAELLAQALSEHLHQRFRIAVRTRRATEGRGLRLFQVRRAGNRHLVDIRPVDTLPPAQRMAGILVLAPADLIASKVLAYCGRRGQPKSGTDWRDLAMLLLQFPELKRDPGPVTDRLAAVAAPAPALAAWRELVTQGIRPPQEDDDY